MRNASAPMLLERERAFRLPSELMRSHEHGGPAPRLPSLATNEDVLQGPWGLDRNGLDIEEGNISWLVATRAGVSGLGSTRSVPHPTRDRHRASWSSILVLRAVPRERLLERNELQAARSPQICCCCCYCCYCRCYCCCCCCYLKEAKR